MNKLVLALSGALVLGAVAPAIANGLGENTSYQFRTEAQRQIFLTIERTRLELTGQLGANSGLGLGGGTGQVGNQSSINVSGSNNTITITQVNNGNQTQTSDCSNTSFDITGGMYGC